MLPILLGITMWLQFKLNPQQMDPVQQQIFAIMPWVLMFVMAPFAAGLQLYWVVSNILTIAQQWWLYKRYGLHYADTASGRRPDRGRAAEANWPSARASCLPGRSTS